MNHKSTKESMEKQLIFTCRKCGHLLFVEQSDFPKKIINKHCPSCGEEPEEIWIFTRLGNYEKEYGK